MRVAVMVISLVLMLVVGLQSCTSAVGGGLSDDQAAREGLSQGAAVGFVVTVLYLLGGAFALGVPLVSTVVFALAAVIGIVGGSTTSYRDLTVWGVVAGALAVMSFVGWLGKRKADRRSAPLVMAQPVTSGARTVTCPRCGTVSPETTRFCPACGLQRPG